MPMTLKAWKEYFRSSYIGAQRGPSDVCGWERDHGIIQGVMHARTWDALIGSVPMAYHAAAVNRCKISEL